MTWTYHNFKPHENMALTKASASKGWRSSTPSPTPTNFTGMPSSLTTLTCKRKFVWLIMKTTKHKEFIATGAYHTAASSRTIEFCQNETSYSNNLLAQLHVKDSKRLTLEERIIASKQGNQETLHVWKTEKAIGECVASNLSSFSFLNKVVRLCFCP